MVSTTDTAIGWTVVGLTAAGAAYYYSQSGKLKRSRGRIQTSGNEQSQRRDSETKKEPKDKRQRKAKGKGKASDQSDQATLGDAEASSASVQTSLSERVKKRKGGKQQQPPGKLAPDLTAEGNKTQEQEPYEENEGDEGMSNADFAKQLLERKTGTSLKRPSTTNETVRTRKQGKRNEELPSQASNSTTMNGAATKDNGIFGAQDVSTASSTTGADADDDLSSQELGHTESSVPSGVDVSDMLEAPKKGPSVLRLTEPSNPQPSRQPKAQKVAPEPETKKQRQNRQKNEMKKFAREEAERARLATLEKQKRDVRVAEGRPMQNGVSTKKAQPLPENGPWTSRPALSLQPPPVDGSGLPPFPEDFRPIDTPPLLDTLEEAAPDVNREPKSTQGKPWERDMPSEEEQMRRISELDSDNAWSTVTKGGKGKKKSATVKTENNTGNGSGSAPPSSSRANGAVDNKFVMASNDADASSDTNDNTSLEADDDDIITAPTYAKNAPTSNGKRH